MEIKELVKLQKDYFASGATLPVAARKTALKKLYSAINSHEKEIFEALKTDLGKSDFEAYMCEIGMTLSEIRYMLKYLNSMVREKRVKTPLAQFPSKSYTKPSPYGNVLIMSPWNYPFLLTLEPLANAIAAGNTAILKPSAYSPATADILEKIISDCFPPKYVAVVKGGRRENAALLEQKFDFVFFTGSQAVGKEVLRHTAETLTPAVLELGGKSPCIVDESANIPIAAKRIVFGKYLNCGQTCVAPDFVLCQNSVKDRFISEVCNQIKAQFGDAPLKNPEYGRMVSEKHFSRVCGLIDTKKVVFGGESDESLLKIAPTVMNNVSFDDSVMQEEIFGPIMPIIGFDNTDEVFSLLYDRPKPLALYVFSENKKFISDVTEKLSFGGGCINDTIIHLATSEMGFGGVGESGMGSYHGKAGFDAFSHTKSIVNKKTWLDLPMRYQPYNRRKFFGTIRKFLK